RNYLKSAWRNLMKYKGFSTINISSLSIGLASCIIIFLFVKDELSFDELHQQNIYRLCEIQDFEGTETQKVALSMAGMGPTMMDDFPEIEEFTRYWGFGDQRIVIDGQNLIVDQVVGVDSSFLNIFEFELLHGNSKSLLNGPEDVVITESTALRLFGDINAVGKTMTMNDGDELLIVRGILADVPENSHLQFDLLVNLYIAGEPEALNNRFGNNNLVTYLVLNNETDPTRLEEKFPDYLIRVTENEDINEVYTLFLQPLADVHLASTDIQHDYHNHRKFNGLYIDVFLFVGILILVIAAVNFTNLTTARASYRSKEVGVRKSIGASKNHLFQQFLIESILLAGMALVIAIILVLIFLPALNVLIDRELTLATFINYPIFIAYGIGVSIAVGLIAGLYPSMRLSSFNTLIVLKGLRLEEKKSFFQSALVVVQFSLALGMIVFTLVVLQQLSFINKKDVGFNKDHLMLVQMNAESQDHYKEMKTELLKKASILGVTASGQRLGNNFHQWGYKMQKDTSIVRFTPSNVYVDFDYLEVHDIALLEGRSFDESFATDDGLSFIINRALADELALESPLGTKMGHGFYPDDSLGTIIGVTENFNFNSLHHKINTLALVVHSEWWFEEMIVKLNGSSIEQGVKDVEEVYGQFIEKYPLKFEFLDDHFNEMYESDKKLGSVITIIAGLAIIVGCMGLFGLSSIAVRRRIKEIGIRKVMGASSKQLLLLMSKDFALLIVLSFIIATPVTYFFMSDWLENFAFRIDINPMIFIVGGIVAFAIAMLTISFHVVRAVNLNPVHSLRDE
ncbi:MAG: FtsX-like permease family protein, partial [Bacteroidota bacterium]